MDFEKCFLIIEKMFPNSTVSLKKEITNYRVEGKLDVVEISSWISEEEKYTPTFSSYEDLICFLAEKYFLGSKRKG